MSRVFMKKVFRGVFISFLFTLFLSAGLVFAQETGSQPSGAPTLRILTPGEGQTLYGSKIPVLFAVDNFKLSDFQNKPQIAGQGHIHVWLDEQNPSKDNAKEVIEDSSTYDDVPYGDHKLTAELVNNDHSSLKPPVSLTVSFKTAQVASSSTPAATSGLDKNTALIILVVVALVIAAAWWYTKDEDDGATSKVLKESTGVGSKAKKSVSKKSSRRKKK